MDIPKFTLYPENSNDPFFQGKTKMAEYDVLVIGVGILGLTTGYHIKLKNPNLRILIVDKNLGAGLGSTVNSAAAFRCFFSSSANFDLADTSWSFTSTCRRRIRVLI
jgi:glycine/D-amino acid oxidase-like deaminating enzyme